MIATRRRPKQFNVGRILLPLAALAALAFALLFPPSHKLIFDGPAAPLFRTLGGGLQGAVQPLSFADRNQTIADRNREIRSLNAKLEDDRKQLDARDATIQQLRAQTARLAAQPASTPTTATLIRPQPAATAFPGAAAADGGAPDDVKRAAAVWGTMDADKAAAIARKLPEPYVASVLRLMSPDTAGDILANLPADAAARLTNVLAGGSHAR